MIFIQFWMHGYRGLFVQWLRPQSIKVELDSRPVRISYITFKRIIKQRKDIFESFERVRLQHEVPKKQTTIFN